MQCSIPAHPGKPIIFRPLLRRPIAPRVAEDQCLQVLSFSHAVFCFESPHEQYFPEQEDLDRGSVTNAATAFGYGPVRDGGEERSIVEAEATSSVNLPGEASILVSLSTNKTGQNRSPAKMGYSRGQWQRMVACLNDKALSCSGTVDDLQYLSFPWN